jgi:hypothetical protein
MPLVSGAPTKKFIKKGINIFNDLPTDIRRLIDDYFPKLNNQFGDRVLRQFNPDYLAKGTDEIVKKSSKSADIAIQDFKRTFKATKEGEEHTVRTLNKIGKYSDTFANRPGIKRFEPENDAVEVFRVTTTNPMKVVGSQRSIGVGFKHNKGEIPNVYDYTFNYDRGSGNVRLVSTTLDGKNAAADFVVEGKTNYMYVIDPKARNAIDMANSQEMKEALDQLDPALAREKKKIIDHLQEIAFIDDIDPRDIKGYYEVTARQVSGDTKEIVKKSEFIPNPFYQGVIK